MKNSVLALGLLLASACASHTGVVSMGRDTYMIAKQKATGFPGLGNLKAEIISEGSEYCSKQGKEFQLISSKETEPPYVLGNYPRSEIQFTCVSRSAPTSDSSKSPNPPPSTKEPQK